MCGDMSPRASRGGLIAAISPYQQQVKKPASPELVLSLTNAGGSPGTHATLSTSDQTSLQALQNTKNFTMRIEKHGDLMGSTDLQTNHPLHSFDLSPRHSTRGIEFDLPYKLDFEVSECGVVGRQATLLLNGHDLSIPLYLGKGIIGWN